jgi:hypothetical protein
MMTIILLIYISISDGENSVNSISSSVDIINNNINDNTDEINNDNDICFDTMVTVLMLLMIVL